ncbi:MAG: hypothetical protein Q4C87_02120 [Actinomycetaceae bacterium]|nr:hypothetical protein [Actinomycetaceae bacterium]
MTDNSALLKEVCSVGWMHETGKGRHFCLEIGIFVAVCTFGVALRVARLLSLERKRINRREDEFSGGDCRCGGGLSVGVAGLELVTCINRCASAVLRGQPAAMTQWRIVKLHPGGALMMII